VHKELGWEKGADVGVSVEGVDDGESDM